MGLREFFAIKSLKQKEAEQRQYNAWAFPYGESQLQRVRNLITELMPDEKQTGIAVYLIGKEAYSRQQQAEDACKAMEAQLPGKHRKKLPMFLALILADAQVDENLNYPDAEALKKQAKELEDTR